MKWLVQVLDSLISHKTDQESLDEQHRLEALITRYKALIPNIELTLVRTDLHSKCYTFRDHAHDVSNRELNRSTRDMVSVPGSSAGGFVSLCHFF